MAIPKFILGDNTDFESAIFVIHTDFPRFIINLEDDQIEWLEDFDAQDEGELVSETKNLMEQAYQFYGREISRYDEK